ncbi:MAG: hypothetical protein Ct9H300mP14_10520 [Gammaproteobacteria bacterium]|nr:MAG: hypothetical protein Ct9H300mP14_10520 [Gammaproteobacteria bacterium]
MGVDCHFLLEDRTGIQDSNYQHNGNVFLDLLHGASLEHHPGGTDMEAVMALQLRAFGPGEAPLYDTWGRFQPKPGALGYVNAALELVTRQMIRISELTR